MSALTDLARRLVAGPTSSTVDAPGRAAPEEARSRASAASANLSGPGPGVGSVLNGQCRLAEVQRPEGVDHDGQLVEVVHADRALDRARLRAMGEPAGVQGARALSAARA